VSHASRQPKLRQQTPPLAVLVLGIVLYFITDLLSTITFVGPGLSTTNPERVTSVCGCHSCHHCFCNAWLNNRDWQIQIRKVANSVGHFSRQAPVLIHGLARCAIGGFDLLVPARVLDRARMVM
jgi:hypothetical protein